MQEPSVVDLLTTSAVAWGHIDTSLHSSTLETIGESSSEKLQPTRVMSRKGQLASRYGVPGKERCTTVMQKQHSWASLDVMDLLDLDEFGGEDDEHHKPTVLAQKEEHRSYLERRKEGMGAKQLHSSSVSSSDLMLKPQKEIGNTRSRTMRKIRSLPRNLPRLKSGLKSKNNRSNQTPPLKLQDQQRRRKLS